MSVTELVYSVDILQMTHVEMEDKPEESLFQEEVELKKEGLRKIHKKEKVRCATKQRHFKRNSIESVLDSTKRKNLALEIQDKARKYKIVSVYRFVICIFDYSNYGAFNA